MRLSDNFVILVVIISIFLMSAPMLIHFYLFDRLLKFEYKNFKDQWLKDGSPNGYFWTSPNSTFWNSTFRRTDFICEKWIFDKPKWIFESAKATDYYNSIRVSWITMYVSFVIGMTLIFVVVFGTR
ncbi:MAG TPA: hypothetical protein PKY82_07400 [Pyrinomonadaceae bacterium]|nr:hypothetical protein [Pyrinomonadaceae bacterium]